MIDYIAELQLAALKIVQRENLEEEYLKYQRVVYPYKHHLRYMLIDFILQYTELNIGNIKEDKTNDEK